MLRQRLCNVLRINHSDLLAMELFPVLTLKSRLSRLMHLFSLYVTGSSLNLTEGQRRIERKRETEATFKLQALVLNSGHSSELTCMRKRNRETETACSTLSYVSKHGDHQWKWPKTESKGYCKPHSMWFVPFTLLWRKKKTDLISMSKKKKKKIWGTFLNIARATTERRKKMERRLNNPSDYPSSTTR